MSARGRSGGSRAGRLRWWLLGGAGVAVAGAAGVLALYLTVPRGNEGAGPVDVLLVLGTPGGMRGELTEMQQWRVGEAVREFQRGAAPRILFSGGPTSHGFTEAGIMSRYAQQLGVPPEDVFEEPHAFTTVQNVVYSDRLIRAHGWQRVEVISTREHLPRAAVLLGKTELHWRTHAAPTPDRGWADTVVAYAEEAVGTAAIRIFGPGVEPVLHTLARGQHGIGWSLRWVLYRVQDWLRAVRTTWHAHAK